MFHYICTSLILILGLSIKSYAILPLQTANNNNLTIREALNKAMQQQTLTQRIAKVYLALNNNLYEPKFYQERDEAIETFQHHLDELKLYTPTERIKQSIKHITALWSDYQKVAHWSINKKGAEKLLSQCDQILIASKQLVSSYEEYAQQLGELYKNSHLVDIVKLIKETGTQQMLTQRIMLFYLAAKQDIEKEVCIKKLQTTAKEYSALITKFEDAPINSTNIQVEIKEMRKYWFNLNKYINFFDDNPAYINSMLLISNELTQKADKIATLYQNLGKKLSISKLLNVIAYQNMLTQRIAKSYVAITYKHAIPKYKRELIASVDLFEEQINTMERSAPTEDTKDAIRVVNLMWKNYRKIALDWQDLDDMKVGKLLEKSHVMMASIDQVSLSIERYAQTIPEYKLFYEKNGTKVSSDNNIAQQVHQVGLQRVYSQRVVVYYIMSALGKDSQLSTERLNQCLKNYEDGHQLLSLSSLNTAAINQSLNNSHKEWSIVVDASKNPSKDNILVILEHSDHLFSKLDKMNELYEKLMDKLITQ